MAARGQRRINRFTQVTTLHTRLSNEGGSQPFGRRRLRDLGLRYRVSRCLLPRRTPRRPSRACLISAPRCLISAAKIRHRGAEIKQALEGRRGVRRGRRQRDTRYRKPRFLNRRRPKGWLPPSLESRVCNVVTWVKRLMRLCPLAAISQELVRFDLQAMETPE